MNTTGIVVCRRLRLPMAALGLAVAIVALGGCGNKRDHYELPSVEVPETYRFDTKAAQTAAGQEEPPGTLPQSVSRWWEHYGNEELNRLVEEGLASNYELKAAISRIAQAQALAGVERADEWPELSGSADYEIESPEGGVGSLEPGERRRSQHLYQVGVQASYEVDLWGKNRAKTQAAMERAWSSVFDRETVALTLTADIVQNFIEYLSLQDRIANANWTRETLSNMLLAVERRVEGGEATRIQYNQQRTAVAASKAVIPVLELQRDQKITALAVLTGRAPSEINIRSKGLKSITFPTVRPGVPSRLLLRRPDIRKIEHDMIAADADIDVARAELFPALNLSAEAGYGARHLDFLFTPESLFFSAGAALTQIIFDAGRRESQIRFEEAQHQELVHTYMQSVYTAIGEVEDSLLAIEYLSDRRGLQQEAVDAAEMAYHFSQQAYSIGAVDYLTMLDTERTLFQQRDELHRTDFDRYVASIDLFRGVGGGIAPDAAIQITNVDRERSDTPPGYFEAQTPARPLVDVTPNLPMEGNWVHLASLWSERAAWRHWRRLQERFPDLLKNAKPEIQTQEMNEGGGVWVNILLGPYAEHTQADTMCATFRHEGNGCRVLTR